MVRYTKHLWQRTVHLNILWYLLLKILSILSYEYIQLQITPWYQFLINRHRLAVIFTVYRKNGWLKLRYYTIGSNPRCGNSCTSTSNHMKCISLDGKVLLFVVFFNLRNETRLSLKHAYIYNCSVWNAGAVSDFIYFPYSVLSHYFEMSYWIFHPMLSLWYIALLYRNRRRIWCLLSLLSKTKHIKFLFMFLDLLRLYWSCTWILFLEKHE